MPNNPAPAAKRNESDIGRKTLLEIIQTINAIEFFIIVLFALAWLILSVLEWLDKKLNPIYPHCHIDPRCHSQFVTDKNGVGHIGIHEVSHNGS